MMYILCKIAYRGKVINDIFRVFSDGEVRDTRGNIRNFEIDEDHHIVKVL